MTFAKKIFIAVFLSTLIIGSLLTWSAYQYVESRAETDFIGRYTAVSKILTDSLTRLDTNTEALMLNAAQVVAAKDKEKGLLSTDELRKLQRNLGVTHLFVIDSTGRFIRSTNEDPANIPNLFSFSLRYRGLLTGELQVEATPIIKPHPEPKPFKFLSIANHNRTRIIEVGVRLDFIANTLVDAVASDKNVLSMSMYAPDGTSFGTFAPENTQFDSEKAQLPSSIDKPIDDGSIVRFFTKVTSSHPECGQCDVSGTSINGEYYYVLESRVSKAELSAIQTRASYIFMLVGLGNLILSYLLARFLARRLVRNIETAVARVRSMKERNDPKSRINLVADDEVAFLTQEFDRLLGSLEESQRKLIETELVRSKVELARVVAHNIKSPVLAIEMMLPGLVTVPERMRRVLKNSVKEINELTEKLKAGTANVVSHNELDTDLVFLPIFLDDLVRQKEHEFANRPEISLSLTSSAKTADGLFAKISSLELKSVLSNIINNAVDAYGSLGGRVALDLRTDADSCIINISDEGAGIPAEYLAKLGRANITFKGERGSGLGLVHAFGVIEHWGGKVEIQSHVGKGTSVFITLPKYSEGQQQIQRALRAAPTQQPAASD